MTTSLEELQRRTEAFDAIVGELVYQKNRAAAEQWTNTPSVPAEILLIEEYVAKARTAYTVNAGDEQALDELRKVAAMCIRAMINHQVVSRQASSSQKASNDAAPQSKRSRKE